MGLNEAILKTMGVEKKLDMSKALGSSELGDFIPVEYANEFIDLVREKNWTRQLFQTVNMPGPVFFIPKVTGDAAVSYVNAEASTVTESKPSFAAAGSVRLDAVKFMGYVLVSNETDEDAKIAMMPFIKNSFAEAMAKAEEETFIMGQFDPAYAADDPRVSLKGLAKVALDAAQVSVADNGNLIKTVEDARLKLGVHGRNTKNLVLLVNPYTASQLRQLNQVLTIDKYGAGATIHQGEIGQLMGIPIITNYYLPEDATDRTTFYNPANMTKGLAILVDKSNPIIGDRRQVRFDQDKVVSKDAIEISITERIGFVVRYAEGVVLITDLENRLG